MPSLRIGGIIQYHMRKTFKPNTWNFAFVMTQYVISRSLGEYEQEIGVQRTTGFITDVNMVHLAFINRLLCLIFPRGRNCI